MLIIGHRGCHYKGFNQNTLRAYKKVIEEGCKAIEIDVQLSLDNQLIVIHNLDLSQVSTGSGLVRTRTLEEIRTYYAGSTDDGYDRIPELSEVLDLWASYESRPKLHLELKGDDTGLPTAKMLATYFDSKKLELNDILVSSFNWKELEIMQSVHPTIDIALLDGSIRRKDLLKQLPEGKELFSKIFSYGKEDYMIPHSADINECYARYEAEIQDIQTLSIIKDEVQKILSGAYYTDSIIETALKMKAVSINLWYESLVHNPSIIQKAHDNNLKVLVYTVNKVEDFKKLIEMNVDGVFTDFYTKAKETIYS